MAIQQARLTAWRRGGTAWPLAAIIELAHDPDISPQRSLPAGVGGHLEFELPRGHSPVPAKLAEGKIGATCIA